MIVFSCPRCQHQYTVHDHDAGQKFACASCGQRLQVPAAPPADTSPAAGSPSHSLSPWHKGFFIACFIFAGLCMGVLVGWAFLLYTTLDQRTKTAAEATNKNDGKSTKPDADSKGPSAESIELARQVHKILETHCYRCHGANGAAEGGFNYILDLEKLSARKKVIAGNPEKSRLYRRVKDEEMPPEGEQPRPRPTDVALIRKWIEAGAPALPAPAQPIAFTSNPQFMEQIHAAQLALPERDRRFARFFTLIHLANAGLRGDELQTYRIALAKLLNGLSWNRQIVTLQPIDPAQTIFRVDIRDYQWNEAVWRLIVEKYPYGVLWDHPSADETFELAGRQMPFVRADWFVAEASRPPLYHQILQLPTTERELEKQLHIDSAEDIRQERVARAGFNSSGVSRNNRLVERHASPFGSYWRSYDFATALGRRNLFAFPLGPGLNNGFVPDGGEIIFSLPNGLNAYMLVNDKGQRLDKGPLEVVSDPNRPDRAVENGISCMSCHARGLIPVKDQIRPHVEKNPESFSQKEVESIQALYPPEKKLTALFTEDNARFRKAVEELGGKLSKTESITGLAAYFEQEVDLKMAAAELGMKPAELSDKLADSPSLLRVLGPLRIPGGTIQRQVFTESMRTLVTELKLGRAI